MSAHLKFHPEVARAVRDGGPVVALESTLITHGFAPPQNLRVARATEAAVRKCGAIPATIAVLHGQITVGLDDEQLEELASVTDARKISRRDLAAAVAQGAMGATTVAGTMLIAHLAGLRVMATGGIGGVHRGHAFDVSADLLELARTPIVVVCAGAKSLLDLPLTLEVLETHGVPVLGYGTDELPAFYSRRSGLRLGARVESPEEVAAIFRAGEVFGLPGGILVTVPVPAEDELPAAEAEAAIAAAVRRADEAGIGGAALTPFVLARIAEFTEGRSVTANIALLINNARVAARIAEAICSGRSVRPESRP